jgi:uncharacterized membrane protein YfhO
MKGYKDSSGKFHPVRQKRYKKSGGRSIIPKIELRLPERKESFAELSADIERDANQRENLIDKNDAFIEKIEANPKSEFTESRKDAIRQNTKVIKNLKNDIKSNIRKLTKDERKQLPENVKTLRRFL